MKVDLKGIKKNVIHVLSGSVLTEGIILRNLHFVFVIVFIIALYISNRYSCISKMAEIQKLERELKDVKYQSQNISTELIGVSRESQVQNLVEKNGLDIKISKEPVYKIEK